MSNLRGYLIIFSSDRGEIYGEFANAEWTTEVVDGEKVNVFTGIPGEGTLDRFVELNDEGISHVAYSFEIEGRTYVGNAEFLAPQLRSLPLHNQIRFETGEMRDVVQP